jgi:hypothetical protein
MYPESGNTCLSGASSILPISRQPRRRLQIEFRIAGDHRQTHALAIPFTTNNRTAFVFMALLMKDSLYNDCLTGYNSQGV